MSSNRRFHWNNKSHPLGALRENFPHDEKSIQSMLMLRNHRISTIVDSKSLNSKCRIISCGNWNRRETRSSFPAQNYQNLFCSSLNSKPPVARRATSHSRSTSKALHNSSRSPAYSSRSFMFTKLNNIFISSGNWFIMISMCINNWGAYHDAPHIFPLFQRNIISLQRTRQKLWASFCHEPCEMPILYVHSLSPFLNGNRACSFSF